MGLSFGEILSSFKDDEDVENVIPIMNSPELQSSIIAWKSVKVKYDSAVMCEYTDPNEQWEWMWAHTQYDVNAFGVIAGLKPQDAGKVLVRLIGLHLIYPDGTIHHGARLYMQSMFKANLTKFSGKPGRPKKQ